MTDFYTDGINVSQIINSPRQPLTARMKQKPLYSFSNGCKFVLHEGFAWLLCKEYKHKNSAYEAMEKWLIYNPRPNYKVFWTGSRFALCHLPCDGRVNAEDIYNLGAFSVGSQ